MDLACTPRHRRLARSLGGCRPSPERPRSNFGHAFAARVGTNDAPKYGFRRRIVKREWSRANGPAPLGLHKLTGDACVRPAVVKVWHRTETGEARDFYYADLDFFVVHGQLSAHTLRVMRTLQHFLRRERAVLPRKTPRHPRLAGNAYPQGAGSIEQRPRTAHTDECNRSDVGPASDTGVAEFGA
jgi:hypothetical protein